MERPARRDFNTATPKQKQHGDQSGKGKHEQPYQKPRENGKGQQGKNYDKGNEKIGGSEGPGGASNPGAQEKDAEETVWMGPDIMGESCIGDAGLLLDSGCRGGREGSEAHDFGPIQAMESFPHEKAYMSQARSSYSIRRGTFPYGRGGTRGGGLLSQAGGRGNRASTNYMSSNQYYSLMSNGEFDVDGCGENEASEMEVQTSSEAQKNIPLCIEGGDDCQITGYQGEASTSPGTILPC